MIENDPDKDWVFNDENNEEPSVEKKKKIKHKKDRRKKPKRTLGSRAKYKFKNLKYKLFKRRYRRISFSPGLLLSIFIPLLVGVISLLVGVIVIYLLEPVMSLMLQYGSFGYGIELVFVFLIMPAEVNSYVPWIAWIASGFASGIISGRILVPFISMYVLTWVMLFIFAGDSLIQGFGYFGGFGLEQIIIQRLVINFIFAILAFGFGGWIGASVGGR